MARRRMFSLELVSSDKFMTLRPAAQAFYFHLNMHADDEGFVSAPRSLGMLCGGDLQDLEQLEKIGYIIAFDSGVVLITHWQTHNTIRKDRMAASIHRAEKAAVKLENGVYVLKDHAAEEVSAEMTTKMATNFSANSAAQYNIVQSSSDKYILDHDSIDDSNPEADRGETVAEAALLEDLGKDTSMILKEPSCSEIYIYCLEAGLTNIDVMQFWSHYHLHKWLDRDGRPIQDWKALVKSWDENRSSE